MDEARKTALMADLEDAKRERHRLDVYIEVLSDRLGVQVDDTQPEGEQAAAPVAPAGPLTDDVLTLVYDNEFHGFKMPKAAEVVLHRWSPAPYQRPVKTSALLAALRKGGMDIKSSRVLYRSLYTAPRFHNLPGSQWGLAEWYPPSARVKGGKAGSNAEAEGQEPLDTQDPGDTDNVRPLAGAPTQPTEEAVS